MSVATKNPFALLDDDNSESSPPAASKAAPAPAPATRGQQKSRGGPASRAGNYYARGGGTRSAPKDQQPAGAEDSTAPERQKRPEGRGRGGRGGGRGGNRDGGNRDGGNREGGRGGRRPFDRHSQTGKTDSDKKLHQSWGGDDGNTELKTEQAATNDAAAEGVASTEWGASTTNDWGTGGGGGDWSTNNAEPAAAESWGGGDAAPAPEADKPEREGRPRREREPEEEDNTLTLDQYIAQQKEKENLPKLEVRRANDGTDENWKDVKPLEKNEDDETYFIGKSKSAPKARAKKEEKVYLEIDARFERPDRGGRGRGGRGGDRDRGRGRGRGGYAPRGGRQTGPALNVDDEVAFPSLS